MVLSWLSSGTGLLVTLGFCGPRVFWWGRSPSVPVPCAGSKPAAAGALCSELGWVQLGFGARSRTLSLGKVLWFALPRLLSHVWGFFVVNFLLGEQG